MKLLLIDIDGLRPDIFSKAFKDGSLPGFEKILGGPKTDRCLLLPVLSPAPSITFTSQACLFTGVHPAQHGIPGNQYFDRFGTFNNNEARLYAFDVGDTLALDDAVQVFNQGLASKCLRHETIYSRFQKRGYEAVVAGHMYADGSHEWLKPSLVNLARFTKGGNLFGMSAAEYDQAIVGQVLDYLEHYQHPDILTVYFLGIDHESHLHGPQAQTSHLVEVIDPLINQLAAALQINNDDRLTSGPLCVVFSDHGQVSVPNDDQHSLRLAFPFENELGHLFTALGLDVHDYPGEDPACDAVVASNGGLAHVYLRDRKGSWSDAPDFQNDILPIARAFWEAHSKGSYAPELEGALAGVLMRDVQKDGWNVFYHAMRSDNERIPLEEWFLDQPQQLYIDPVNRLNNMINELVGDILLISNYGQGYYFASPTSGMHGGLHPEDSWATLAVGWPGKSESAWYAAQETFQTAIMDRCRQEGSRLPSTADVIIGINSLID